MGLAVLTLLLNPRTPSARTWHIAEDGSGDAPTIQAGMDSAAVGDEVSVGPGNYLENLDFGGKDIAVRSELGAALTIINAVSPMEAVIVFRSGEKRQAILEGFTVRGGGRGILVASSEPSSFLS